MAQNQTGPNHRPQQRPSVQKRRNARRRRAKLLRYVTAICVLAVCCIVAGVLIFRSLDSGSSANTQPPQTTTLPPAQTAPSTAPIEPETVIRLVFGGDLNITERSVAAGLANGGYDYSDIFLDITAILAEADAAFINLEGGFYGSGAASAPRELADALSASGVDMVQLANSYSIYSGLTGLSATADTIRDAGMLPVGAFPTAQDREESQGFTLVNIGGLRVAIVAFTKGMDGMSLPAGSEGCVNLLYTDYATTYQQVNKEGIETVLKAAQAQQPDLTIAMVHWGSEYNDTISPTQKTIVKLMTEAGVDAIIGTHSHFVQQVAYDEAAGTVVAYSLGDLFGNAEKAGTNYSLLLQLEVTRNNHTGETKITACDYTGIYTLTPEKDGMPMQILRILPALEMYDHNHVGKVTQQAYENMKYAWQRIQARADGT